MATYYVETFRPPDPGHVLRQFRVIPERQYSRDCLSPTLTSLWRVDNVGNKNEALAAVLERAAGLDGNVHLISRVRRV